MRLRFVRILLLVMCLCAPALAEGGAQTEPPSPFSGAFAEAVWTVIVFAILLFALWKLVWKKMIEGLVARQEYIAKQISNAENTSSEADKVLADYRDRLSKAEQKGREIIGAHTKQAEKQAQEVIDRAIVEVKDIKARAQDDIDRARDDAQAELFDKAGEIVLELGQEILGKSMNRADNEKLTADAIERLRRQKPKG